MDRQYSTRVQGYYIIISFRTILGMKCYHIFKGGGGEGIGKKYYIANVQKYGVRVPDCILFKEKSERI